MDKNEFDKKYKKTLNTQGRDKIWNYFLDLIKTEKFQKEIENFRIEIKQNKEINYIKLNERIRLTAIIYGLDCDDWEETLTNYIYTNKLEIPESIDMCKIITLPELEESFVDEEKEDFDIMESLSENDKEKYLKNKKEILKYKSPLEHLNIKMNLLNNYPIAILINPKASLRDIQDFITKNYDLRVTNLKKAFKNSILRKNNLGNVKKKNNFIQERNEFIYQNKHLPSKVIMRMLYEKYGNNFEIDQGYIGKIISMEEKKRKEV